MQQQRDSNNSFSEKQCKSCTGLLIYTDMMKANQKPPVCLGILSKSESNGEATFNNTEDDNRDNIDTFVGVGHSTFNSRSLKDGRLPELRYGCGIYFEKAPEMEENNTSPPKENTSSHSSAPMRPTVSNDVNMPTNKQPLEDLSLMQTTIYNRIMKGSTIQLSRMNLFYTKIPDILSKVPMNTQKLYMNMNKTGDRIFNKITSIFSNK